MRHCTIEKRLCSDALWRERRKRQGSWRGSVSRNVADPLMRPDGVVVLNVLFHDIRNLTLVYCEEIIQRFVSNGFHEPLGDRVHVRCFDRCRNAANAVERIVEQKLLSVVVNEIDWTIDEMLELDELLTHEFARRNLCHGDSGDLTSFVPDYEEYIEPLAEYRVDSKEIHGKD